MRCSNVGKCIILFIVLIVLKCPPCKSQSANHDNLLNVRIDSLLFSTENLLKYNLKEAFEIIEEAKRFALISSNNKQIIRAVCLESFIKVRTNQSTSALSDLSIVEANYLKQNDSTSRAEIFAAKGLIYFLLSNYDSSKVNYEKSIQIFKAHGNKLRTALELNRLARVYLRSGESKNAISVSESSSRLFDNLSDKEGKALSLDLKGELFSAQRLYDKALITHHAALEIFKALQNIEGIAIAEVHIGNAWYMKVMDDSALFYYQSALKNYRLVGDSNGIAICYANLSRVFLEKNELRKSIDYANLTLTTIAGGDYKLIESTTYQQLGDIYAELKEYSKAIIFLKRSLFLATGINHKVTIMDCRKSLSEVYFTLKNADSAYVNLLEAYHYKDTLQPIVFSKELAELQNKYEVEKQQVILNSLQQQDKIKSLEIDDQQNQINRRNTIIFSGLIIFLLVAFVIYLAYQRQKLAQDIGRALVVKNTEERERIRFARDLHDEVGSGLSKISFLSGVLVSSNTLSGAITEKAVAIHETSNDLVDSMRDLIWTLNPENTSLENLIARIREFTSDYLEEFPIAVHFDFPAVIPDLMLFKQSHREIFMTIKESLNNIVKHSRATMVSMKLEIKNNFFYIRIVDNGKGFSNELEQHGNGIRNMKNRISGIEGEFSIGKNLPDGVIISIKVPFEKLSVA